MELLFAANSTAAANNGKDSVEVSTTLPHIEQRHWQEWLDSGVAPEIIGRNVKSLAGETPYDYLCYSNSLPRTNLGRLTAHTLRLYTHAEDGGWWCSGIDPLTGEPMLWGCFKPDRPRIDPEKQKAIKYEHPPKTPTRAFFLDVPDAIWAAVAQRYGIPPAYTSDLHRFVKDGKITSPRPGFEFWQWVLAHPELPIILVEGAKKAASLLSQGYIAIALPGVFNGRRVMRDEFGKIWVESLLPDLDLFAIDARRIYFCFDHDTKPKTIKNVNIAIFKTGKLLAQQGCDVQVIILPGPEKGVDDFIVSRGSAEFEQVYKEALPLSSWHWRIKKQSELTYTPSLVLNTSELKLKASVTQPLQTPIDELLVDEPALECSSQAIIGICSPKGTGKTKYIAGSVAKSQQLALIGHRIALMRNLCQRLGAGYKGDLDKVNGEFITGSAYTLRVGLCVDSLLSINPEKFAGCDLVIDEVEQVLRHLLTSSTCNKDGKRPALLARLHWLIRVARRIIVADADLSDSTLTYLRALKGSDTPVHLIRNDYQPEGYPTDFIQASRDDAIIRKLLTDIEAGLKVFVATDAKSGSKAITKLVERLQAAGELSPPVNLVLINSETSGGEYEVEFIRNINQHIKNADIVIATPSMATGVSIEVKHFDKVYGLFYGTVTDADAAQALSRVRDNVPRVVWCARQGKNFSRLERSEYPWKLKQALKTQWDQETSLIRTSLRPDLMPGIEALDWDSNPHIDLWAEVMAKTNAAMWNLRDNLLERLRFEGNLVEVVCLDQDEQVRVAMTDARILVKQERYQAVAAARMLNKSQQDVLERQEALNLADQLSLEKTQIAEFYCQETVTPELVEFDNDGKRRGQITELEALLHNTEALAFKRDQEAIARQVKYGHGLFPPDHPCYELRRFARERLGLVPFLIPGQKWTDEDLEPLGQVARECCQQVRKFFGFKIPQDPEQATNIWIFRRLLQQLGVKTEAHRQGREQTRSVWIEVDAWTQLMGILEHRQAKRQVPVVTSSLVVVPDVVPPPDINKMQGVTTSRKLPLTAGKDPLTSEDLQAGESLLREIAETETPEKLSLFKVWTENQKHQLWIITPQVIEKIWALLQINELPRLNLRFRAEFLTFLLS